MKRSEFLKLQLHGRIVLPGVKENNPLLSQTDPTLDVSLEVAFESMRAGRPLDLPVVNSQFNGVKVDDMSVLESRGSDKFDVFAEVKKTERQLRSELVKYHKKNKKNEKQEN